MIWTVGNGESEWPPICSSGQAIIFYLCGLYLLFSSFSFFLAYSQRSYYHRWCGLSVNLECRSETCCMQLAKNTGCKQLPKIRCLHTIAQLCLAISSQLRHVLAIGKNLLNSNISSTCAHNMVSIGPLMIEIGWWVWGTPAVLNGFRVWALLLQRHRSTDVNQTLHDIWPSPGLVHYIYTFSGALAP